MTRNSNYYDPGGHFNMGIFTLVRMNEVLQEINMLRRTNGDAVEICKRLEILYNEVETFITKKDDVKKAEELLSEMKLSVKSFSNIYKKKVRGGLIYSDSRTYENGQLLERFLRKVMYDNDLLMRKPEDTSERF
jgi:hypothetical protein